MARARGSRARRRPAVGPHGGRGGALPRLWRGLVLGRAGPAGRRRGPVAADRADPRRARRCGRVRRRVPLREGGQRQPLGLRDPQGRAVLKLRCNISTPTGVSIIMKTDTKYRAILVIATLWSLLHVYVGQRLLAQTSLAPVWRVLGWVGILLLVLAPFVALAAGRTERLPAKRGLEVAGFTAMGLSSLLIVFALAGDVLHVRAWLGVGGSQLAVVGGAMAVLLIGLWRARRAAPGGGGGGPLTGGSPGLAGVPVAQLSHPPVGPPRHPGIV